MTEGTQNRECSNLGNNKSSLASKEISMASRECAGKHLGSSCTGPPSILCGSCGAVGYCSPFHQRLHWIEHTHDCERWANQMRLGAVLHDFPFSFAQQSTFHIDMGMLTRCAFLESRGLHLLGLWKPECECRHIRPSVSGRGAALAQYFLATRKEN